MSNTEQTIADIEQAIEALPNNEVCSWYMSTVNCPDDMEAKDLKLLATLR